MVLQVLNEFYKILKSVHIKGKHDESHGFKHAWLVQEVHSVWLLGFSEDTSFVVHFTLILSHQCNTASWNQMDTLVVGEGASACADAIRFRDERFLIGYYSG